MPKREGFAMDRTPPSSFTSSFTSCVRVTLPVEFLIYNFALIRILFPPQPATPMSRVDCIAGKPRMTDGEYDDAYMEALLCLSETAHVGQPFGRDGVRICSVDGCLLDDDQVLERWWGKRIARKIQRQRRGTGAKGQSGPH